MGVLISTGHSTATWGQCKSVRISILKMCDVIIRSLERREKQSETTVDKIPAEMD